MTYVPQDLTLYFQALKNELVRKTRKKNLKCFLIFLALTQGMVFLAYQLLANQMLPEGHKVDSFSYYFMAGFALFFSGFYYLSISMNTDINILNNKDKVNLYDGLTYLHRNKKKDMNDDEFFNLIDAQYEKRRLQDLLINVNENKEFYAKTTANINAAYANKETMVNADKILKMELQ